MSQVRDHVGGECYIPPLLDFFDFHQPIEKHFGYNAVFEQ